MAKRKAESLDGCGIGKGRFVVMKTFKGALGTLYPLPDNEYETLDGAERRAAYHRDSRQLKDVMGPDVDAVTYLVLEVGVDVKRVITYQRIKKGTADASEETDTRGA